MEQYQDLWVNGTTILSGKRECADRYEIVKAVCSQFSRPFSVLDIGANLGYFSLRIADEFPEATCFSVEGNDHYAGQLLANVRANALPNVCMLKQRLDINLLKKLGQCEHFDIILGMSVVHHFGGNPNDVIAAMSTLGDHLILEVPVESNAHNPSAVKAIEIKPEWNQIGVGKSHIQNTTRPIFWVQGGEKILTRRHLKDQNSEVLEAEISSTFDSANIKIREKGEDRSFYPGMNLANFKVMNGLHPNVDDFVEQILAPEFLATAPLGHGDIRPWNIIVSGAGKLNLIDIGDPRGRGFNDADGIENTVKWLRDEQFYFEGG